MIDETKEIKLLRGEITLVNNEDFNRLSKFIWHLNNYGYVVRSKGLKTIMMHREILETPEGFDTDHINRNKLDNRRCNLRVVTRSQNMLNINPQVNNSTGYTGVVWDKQMKKWRSQIMLNRKQIFLALSNEMHEAITIRKNFERRVLP